MVKPPLASTSPRRKRPGPLPKPIAPFGLTSTAPLSGTPGGGILLGLAYVFGMTFPAGRDGAGLGQAPSRRAPYRRGTAGTASPGRTHAGHHACFYQMRELEQHAADLRKAGITVLPIVMNPTSQISPELASFGLRTLT